MSWLEQRSQPAAPPLQGVVPTKLGVQLVGIWLIAKGRLVSVEIISLSRFGGRGGSEQRPGALRPPARGVGRASQIWNPRSSQPQRLIYLINFTGRQKSPRHAVALAYPIGSRPRGGPIPANCKRTEFNRKESRASEILSRRRPLTVDMIHKISEAWKIPADLLVRPYKIERAA